MLLADQLSKWVILRSFEPGQSIPLVRGILHLTYVQNTGAAFGLLRGMTPFLVVLSLGVAAWILRELRAGPAPRGGAGGPSGVRLWALSLVLGGAVGNLVDRIWRAHVVDFIDLRVWPVFNLADSAITIGVGLLILPLLITQRRRARRP